MSQINFEKLKAEAPKLGPAWDLLERMFPQLQTGNIINLSLLRPYVNEDVGTFVALALNHMVQAGLLKQYYQFQTPGGRLIGPRVSEPNLLPEQVDGRFGTEERAEDLELVTLFGAK